MDISGSDEATVASLSVYRQHHSTCLASRSHPLQLSHPLPSISWDRGSLSLSLLLFPSTSSRESAVHRVHALSVCNGAKHPAVWVAVWTCRKRVCQIHWCVSHAETWTVGTKQTKNYVKLYCPSVCRCWPGVTPPWISTVD